jgi:hypothetical protein
MSTRRSPAMVVMGVLLVSGCNSILGIEQKDYPDAESDASADATMVEEASADSPMVDDRGPDGPMTKDAAQDARADVTYPTCTVDGSTGEVCGPVSYGAWSTCSYAATCDDSGSRTRSVKTPTCSAGACSSVTTMATDTAGCMRNTDGTTCGTGMACTGQVCKCAPQCAGKNCGSDACGGSCGSCSGTNSMCNSGVCQCTPTAGCTGGGNVGNVCGPDDGCGGPCTCDTANGEMCGSNNKCCHVATWFCTTNGDCCSGSCNIGPNVCN